MDESYFHENEPGKELEKWRYYEVRGRHGTVYPYGWEKPAVYYHSNKIANRDRKKGWKCIQRGDEECVFLIPMEDLEYALASIKPWHKRHISHETAERLKMIGANTRYKKSSTAISEVSGA